MTMARATLAAVRGSNNPANPGTAGGKSPDVRSGKNPNLRLNHAATDRVADEPRRVVDLELPHDAGPVRLGRLGADAQSLSDLLGRLAFRDELKDLAFTLRQRIFRQRLASEVGVYDDARDCRGEIDLATADLLDRPHEMRGGLRLENISLEPRVQGCEHVLVLGVHGQRNGAD